MIDLRSDTVTHPTSEMLEAMTQAKLGDDVFRDDPTVQELEERAAALVGKEAALFVPSGTMGNLVALLTHTSPGDEIILEAHAHTAIGEGGGLARIAGLMPRLIPGVEGAMPLEAIEAEIRGGEEPSGHLARTGLVCLENTHNRAGGIPLTVRYTREVCELAHRYKIPVHLDGARVFNAALALGVDVKELTCPVDSVMFCLSKGLSAPIGSVLAGSKEFIDKARGYRQLLGGGMRQAGVIAAAGIVALKRMIDRLKEDHDNAALLAERLRRVPGLKVPHRVCTNIVYVEIHHPYYDAFRLQDKLAERGIEVIAFDKSTIRLVTHFGISREDVLTAAEAFEELLGGGKQ